MPALEKEFLMKQLENWTSGNQYVFFAQFKGISVIDLNDLRRRLEKITSRVVVVKNSIARIVLERIQAKDAVQFLEGQVILFIGKDDPQIVSKMLVDFAKDRENFVLKGIFIDQKVFQNQFVKELAKLPSKKELIGAVMGGMQAPIGNFVFGLGGLIRSLVNVLGQVQKQKGQSGS